MLDLTCKTSALQIFHEEEITFNTFVSAHGYTQYVLVNDTECKLNFGLLKISVGHLLKSHYLYL